MIQGYPYSSTTGILLNVRNEYHGFEQVQMGGRVNAASISGVSL